MTRAETIRDWIIDDVAASGFGAHGLHVLAGADAAEHRWRDDMREDVHSVAKGVCVLAAGMAADEGRIDVDAPLSDLVEDMPLGVGVENVTLRRLLTMTSGIDMPWSETEMSDWPDLAAEFLSRPSRGVVFQYANASTYTAMTILSMHVGDVLEYLRPRLFTPLGIGAVEWQRCPNGRIIGGGGLLLRTSELARIGQLIRDRGSWVEQQLVSTRWIDAMHTDWVTAGTNPGYQRYAMAGWDGPGRAWRLHGAHGQLLLFLDDTVVTITASDHFAADAFAGRVIGMLER
jgi:CubicO group peptidase (beta-lactamase class C family)